MMVVMGVYLPGEDTRLILEALRDVVKPGMRVLDMGTGSGVLGFEAKRIGARVLCVDINPEAVELARNLGLEARVSDMFENVDGKFDLVVFNPPYLELSGGEKLGDPMELAIDGGKMGREILDRFLDEVGDYLSPGGRVLFLQAEFNGLDETRRKLREKGFNFKIVKKRYVAFEGWLFVFLAWRD